MTSRERMERAFAFQGPDKIPVYYHPSKGGLHVHGEKLLELLKAYPPDNPVEFMTVPHPPEEAYNERGEYHQILTDSWQTGIEYSIYGIAGIPVSYPFNSWEEAENYIFPSYHIDVKELNRQRNQYLTFTGTVSIFEKLHSIQPFEKVLIDIVLKDPGLMRFLDRLTEYWKSAIQYYLDSGSDIILFGDDWGSQNSSIISPLLFREIFKPRYEELFQKVKEAGKRVFLHSCGYLGDVLSDFIELGIDGLWPQIGYFERDERLFEHCQDAGVVLFIHPDRQRLIPMGTPDEIEASIAGYSEKYHRLGGGGIFYVEIENDAPFKNVERLIRSIDKYR